MKFVKNILLLVGLLFSFDSTAQCLSVDCNNGEGKIDYGYAIYTGTFKNGKPHGTGTMDYGAGEKYVGTFVDGKEDGEGILYKGDVTRKVLYRNGKIVQETNVVNAIGGNAPKIDGCNSGNCLDGVGTMVYPSGNKYNGHFKNGQRHGNGSFTFVSGNTFIGEFQSDLPIQGTFNYKQEAVSFTGKVNEDCTPQTGNYYYPGTGATVTIQNGKITKIANPAADRLHAQMEATEKPSTCTRCNGKGISGYSRVSVTNTVENVGVDRYLNGRYTTTTRYGNTSFPDICTECGGKGVIVTK